jgi:carboxypeptidase Q
VLNQSDDFVDMSSRRRGRLRIAFGRSSEIMIRVCRVALFALGVGLALPAWAQSPSSVPAEVIEKIKEEGLQRSQVMQTLSYLTDVIGPRLTGTPGLKRANEWTRDTMTKWGLQNAHLEAWGPFGRGWTLEKYSAHLSSPQFTPIIAYPKAWSPSLRTNAPIVFVDATDAAGLEKYRGKLRGAIVLNGRVREVKALFDAPGRRYTDEQLARIASGETGRPGGTGSPMTPPAGAGGFHDEHEHEQPAAMAFNSQKSKFFQSEGVALIIDPSSKGDGGTLFVQSASVPSGEPGSPRRSAWDKDAPRITPQLVMAIEDYNRLMRLLQQGEKPTMSVEIKSRFHDKDLMAYNTIAELPGSDKKDEIVMVGAHLDSWHASTGATDNAAGCAVAMEAMRILKALNLQPRRTIRIGLWTGEEQGLFGSRAYVAQHFAERPRPSASSSSGGSESPSAGQQPGNRTPLPPLVFKPEYEKFSAYFNLDNGTGKIRGIYCQRNEGVRDLFAAWLTPFKDMDASTVTLSNTGGTDHQAFDGVGLPGFQFIQDPIEYSTRTHHSNQDNYDRIQADDVKQAAIIMATFAYQAAMRDELLPRKPRP